MRSVWQTGSLGTFESVETFVRSLCRAASVFPGVKSETSSVSEEIR